MWIIRGEQEYTQEAGGVRAGGYRAFRGGDGAGFEQTFQRRFFFFFFFSWRGEGELSHFGHETQTSPRQGTRKFFKAPIKGLGEVRGF